MTESYYKSLCQAESTVMPLTIYPTKQVRIILNMNQYKNGICQFKLLFNTVTTNYSCLCFQLDFVLFVPVRVSKCCPLSAIV